MNREKRCFVSFTIAAVALLSFCVAAPGLAQEAEGGKGKLTGSELFSFHCGRCHAERQPRERSDYNWDIISTHMRVKANLSAKEEAKIKEFLQSSN